MTSKPNDPTMSADAHVAWAQAATGLIANRYEIESELGRGGMGVVYRARDTLLGGEVVALKMLFGGEPSAIERFRREVLLARRITSPHVARTHDLGEHGGQLFLTMELIEGESLGRRIAALAGRGQRMPIGVAVQIARSIALGLGAAHEAGVVHRDLKPDNVLLSDAGRVVVTDFGIARAVSGPEAARATHGIAGTPAYMAPEQLEGKPLDARTDLYALGVLLYECLSGALPFEGETPIATAIARLHEAPRPLPRDLGVPGELAAVLDRLLARAPADRFATALEVAQALTALPVGALDALPAAATVASMGPGPAPPSATASTRNPVGVLVMQFEHRGPPDDAHITQTVQRELVDLLSRTGGLRVTGSGSLDGVADARTSGRTPARFAAQASVHVAERGARLRASVRLIDIASSVQLGAETIEHATNDPFDAAEVVAAKMAESFRLLIEAAAAEGRVSPEALDAYRQARKSVRHTPISNADALFAQLDRAIALAPTFPPPLALHALASVRRWFTPQTRHDVDYGAEARASVARAVAASGQLPETRFAMANVAWQEARLRDAVTEARAALSLAPAYPDALAFLGQLELEAGRPEDGLKRLARARALEPSLRLTVFEPARWHGLYGDMDEFHRLVRTMRELREDAVVAQYFIRVGAWRNDDAMVREGVAIVQGINSPLAAPLLGYASTILGGAPPEARPEWLASASPRLSTITFQMIGEALAKSGQRDQALAMVEAAANAALTDLEWTDKCPLLDALRDDPRFRAARQRVYARCEEIWLAS